MNENVAAALEVLHSGGGDPLGVAVAAETVKAWVDARQLRALHVLDAQQPAFLDDTGRMIAAAPAEAAAALSWSTRAAQDRVDLAAVLLEDLPEVFDALNDGRIDVGKAREIADRTCELDVSVRRWLARRACDYATDHTRGQLRAWLARRIARIDPQAADRKHPHRSRNGVCGCGRRLMGWPPSVRI